MTETDPFFELFPPLPRDRPVLARLAALLGEFDPDAGGPFGLRRGTERDEDDVFISDAIEAFRGAGLTDLVLPHEQGGLMRQPLEDQWVGLVASRDMSAAVALNNIGFVLKPFQFVGTPEQRSRYYPLAQHARLSFGMTEWDHGSDVLANETRAVPVRIRSTGEVVPCARGDDGFTHYQLSGEKRIIGSGNVAEFLLVLARTDDQPGPGGVGSLSLFVVDKGTPGLSGLPRFKTHGIRGVNVSGARLDAVVVPRANLIGREGEGFRLVRRTVEVARGTLGCLASGQLLQGLRLACRWSRARELYGKPIFDLPPVQAALTRAYVELELIAALSGKTSYVVRYAPLSSRDLTCQTKLFCSAAFQALVDLSWVIGARSYLRDQPFERLLRDSRILTIFDGTAHVQEVNIAAAFARPRPSRAIDDPIGRIRAYRDEPAAVDLYGGDRSDWLRGGSDEVAALDRVKPELMLGALAIVRRVVERILAAKCEFDHERGPLTMLAARTSAIAALAERIVLDEEDGVGPDGARRAGLRLSSIRAAADVMAIVVSLDPARRRELMSAAEEDTLRAETDRLAAGGGDARHTILERLRRLS